MKTLNTWAFLIITIASQGFALSTIDCTELHSSTTLHWDLLGEAPTLTVTNDEGAFRLPAIPRVHLIRARTRLTGCLQYSAAMMEGQAISLIDCGEKKPFGNALVNVPEARQILLSCTAD